VDDFRLRVETRLRSAPLLMQLPKDYFFAYLSLSQDFAAHVILKIFTTIDICLTAADNGFTMFRTCIEIKTDGVQCGSPALRNHLRCHWHSGKHVTRILNSRTYKESVVTPEGRLQTVNHVLHALLNGHIDHRSASSAFYAVQIASQLPQSEDFGDNSLASRIFPGLKEPNS
jgi:hypothetical protein